MRNFAKVLAPIFLAGSLAGCASYGGSQHNGQPRDWQNGGNNNGLQLNSYNYASQGNGEVLNWQARQQNNIHRQ